MAVSEKESSAGQPAVGAGGLHRPIPSPLEPRYIRAAKSSTPRSTPRSTGVT